MSVIDNLNAGKAWLDWALKPIDGVYARVVEVTVRTDPAIMRATRFYPDRLLIL